MAIAAIGFTACQTKTTETVGTPTPLLKDKLTKEEAKEYVKLYETHAGTVDSIRGGLIVDKKPNTRCIWFSAKQLEAMLATIKQEKGDGVRFYLATYKLKYDVKDDKQPKKDYWGFNTLVMVSTEAITSKASKDTIHRDYYVERIGNSPARGFIVGTTPENRGEMCPPPRECTGTGATLIDTLKR
jgi:hypothetical protein